MFKEPVFPASIIDKYHDNYTDAKNKPINFRSKVYFINNDRTQFLPKKKTIAYLVIIVCIYY